MQPPIPPPRILLVEDALDQAVLVGRWLTRYLKAQVSLAVTGQEAIDLLKKQDFDVMLADIEIPGISGIEVARQAHELRPYMATAIMTAHGSIEYATRAIQSKVADFVVKPLRRDDLIEKVNQLVLASHKRRNERQRTVLAIGAHPDDAEIGCGGILLRHRAAGDRIIILTLSRGSNGGSPERRVEEAQRAATQLNAELHFADLPDCRISAEHETISIISSLIQQVAPDTVYTHSINDTHQDHRAVHHATIVAARAVPNLYCYQSPSSTISFCPLVFVDVTSHMREKLTLLQSYESQTSKCAYLDPELIQATARYWGRFAQNGRVEPLEVVRAVERLRTAV